MADTSRGVLSPADIILLTDGLATVFKGSYANFNTLTTACQALRGKVLGDGTQVGLANANFKSQLNVPFSSKITSSKYDRNFQKTDRNIVSLLNSNVSGNLPPSWSFSGLLPLDGYLTRCNANNSSTPATPGSAGTLTGVTTSGGSLSTTTSGNAVYVVHTLVGSADYFESQPSAEATRVALTGSKNSYTYQIASTVPTGVTKVRVYRSLQPGTSTQWYYDQTVSVIAGASYPAITIYQPDSMLRQDWVPPLWCGCMMTAEFATVYADSTATLPVTQSVDTLPLAYNSATMLSPGNVMMGPSNGWMGDGNVPQGSIFETHDVSTTVVTGTIQSANLAANNIQGFAGSLGKGAQSLIVRTTTNLNNTYHPVFTVTYFDATHPCSGSPTTATGVVTSADFAGSTPETVYITVTAGRLVTAVTETSHTGSAATGVILTESNYGRTY